MKVLTTHTPNINEDEGYLIEQCKKQNPMAQKALYEKYYKQMYPLCLRYLKNEEDAAEIANMGFLKVFNKISTFKAEGNFSTWLKRIFIYTAIDSFRTNKNYKKKFITTSEFAQYGFAEENTTTDYANEAKDFTQAELLEMIKELPPATRTVFNLYAIDEFKHKEIAKQLKISIGTSKWHLANARKLLIDKIKLEQRKKNNEKNGTRNI